jgi:hypothetical protein
MINSIILAGTAPNWQLGGHDLTSKRLDLLVEPINYVEVDGRSQSVLLLPGGIFQLLLFFQDQKSLSLIIFVLLEQSSISGVTFNDQSLDEKYTTHHLSSGSVY